MLLMDKAHGFMAKLSGQLRALCIWMDSAWLPVGGGPATEFRRFVWVFLAVAISLRNPR